MNSLHRSISFWLTGVLRALCVCFSDLKSCDSNFEVNRFHFLKFATNETTTLHYTICTRIAHENYNNNDQQFKTDTIFDDSFYLGPRAVKRTALACRHTHWYSNGHLSGSWTCVCNLWKCNVCPGLQRKRSKRAVFNSVSAMVPVSNARILCIWSQRYASFKIAWLRKLACEYRIASVNSSSSWTSATSLDNAGNDAYHTRA